jgi:hypothetical protein
MPMLSGMAALIGPDVQLSAVLIVRDEADEIAGCLASLRDVVDEVVVYDTGSLDDTREQARAGGVLVVDGFWDDDFGRARTRAAESATGTWLLTVDADERLRVDPGALRAILAEARAVDGFSVRIDNTGEPDGTTGYANWTNKIVRRGAVRWTGAVHEQVITLAGADPVVDTMPSHVLSLEHHGYADPERVHRKAERNATLAQAELDRLGAQTSPDPVAIGRALLNLGRSLIGVGRLQHAVDTFEAVREIVPGTQSWSEATDHLARLLLGAGQDEVVVELSQQLFAAGADRRYCDWLRAQALAQLGQPEEALRLIRGVDELIDPVGRRYDVGQVLEVRSLLASLVGRPDEALAMLTLAVARHGRIRGRGPLLLELWGEGPPSGLATMVRQAGSPTLVNAVADELRASGGVGPAVAAALAP